MEVIQELHDAVAKACETSFDNAYQQMKSKLEAQTKAAETRDSAANQAQRKAETRIEELQRENALLRNELKQCEVDPRDLELPKRYADLEAEFDPKNLWESHLDDAHPNTRKSRKRVEAKYTALYTSLQACIESWSDLKGQVLRHKRKLKQWSQQLKDDEFALVLNGQMVKYRRIPSHVQDVDKEHSQTTQRSSRKRPREQDPDLPAKVSKPSPIPARNDDMEATVHAEDDGRVADHTLTSEPASTQSSSPGPQMEALESLHTTHALPNISRRSTRQATLPALSNSDHANSQRMDVGPKCPIQVKNEIMSSSPIRASINFSERPFGGTQDLDDIGDTIQTPMKRKAYRDAQAANTQNSKASIDHANDLKTNRQSQQPDRQPSVLRPVDGNARTTTISGQGSSTKRLADLERRIPAMAEDGDSMTHLRKSFKASSGTDHRPSEAKTPGVLAQRRLESLLEGSTPSRSPLRSSKRGPGLNATKADVIPKDDHITPKISSRMAPEIDPDDEPYRARSLGCLGLGHFKINPARNQGLDFAYDTVVRKKDERKCISGCTRPGCCGDRFRAMVRLGGLPGRSEMEQEQEDEILREFVGENTQLLQNLNGQERENLVVEAKARALANQYGRHRHTHQRAQSPPGFWRTDMPSTQEEELDREAAKGLEREKVEERYREAMRPGGLWIFADE